MDESLLLFRRQYLQLFEPDFLAWPPAKLLRAADAQIWIYKHLFDESQLVQLPPRRYQAQVLRKLVAQIQKASADTEEKVRGRVDIYLSVNFGS